MRRVWGWLAIFAAVCGMWLVSSRRSVAESGANAGAVKTSADDAKIQAVLDAQLAAWNRGDIDGFMKGYWNSPGVEFVSANGVTRGYDAVLARYKKGFPTQAAMGKLSFTDLEVHVECAASAYVYGQYHLQLALDNPTGFFTLNFRKFKDGWKIVLDHTTNTPKAATN
jgi:ketosteroid isomerase-like protein